MWEIYKHHTSGPKLRMTVGVNMMGQNIAAYEGKLLVMARVSNFGDRPTTLTHFAVQGCKRNWWGRERTVKGQHGIIVSPNSYAEVPFELRPGMEWAGFAIQKPLEEWIASGSNVYIYVIHSHSNKPIRGRVVITLP